MLPSLPTAYILTPIKFSIIFFKKNQSKNGRGYSNLINWVNVQSSIVQRT